MGELKDTVIKALFENALTFLNCSIQAINQGLSDRKNQIVSIVNLQMALELAMKAKVVEKYEVSHILQNLASGASDTEIRAKYESNDLKVKDFETIKNFLKSEGVFNFSKPDYRVIERFQLYRNRLVHFNYNFSKEENEQIEHDIFYVLVYLLGTIMGDGLKEEKPTYMQEYIDIGQYEQLMQNRIYTDILTSFIIDTYEKPYYCPICSRKYLTPSRKCLGCLWDVSERTGAYGYIDCKYCGTVLSVLYDRLNIDGNKGMARGLCINCVSDTIVYKCSCCGKVFDFEGIGDFCVPGRCIHME